ncbi:stimulator of interferon genes protein [Chanos chanos]|uniref:Stimulator of interferon genes protein n=1 Tax=Chanos chanos TaxID=29144 RepID=A0A6J2UU26_CHACN|nr:stimulator of interferon genes protein [Chanos chanos]
MPLMGESSLVPCPRGKLPVLLSVVLFAIILVAVVVFHDRSSSSIPFWDLAVLGIFSLTLGPTVYGLCLFIEEWLFHSHQRYGGNLSRMLAACFGGRAQLAVCMAVLMLLVREGSLSSEQWNLVALCSALYLLFKSLGVLNLSPVEISEICESRKMNVAHGLAWSFYLGYLKLVLPELEGLVKQYYNLTGEVLRSPRLYILLPLNAAVSAKLEEEDNLVSFHKNLPQLERDRAGVRSRVYKHSVYKVIDNNKEPHLCVVEYATPLLTLYQMSQDNSAGFSEKERRQQVLLFYRTLRDILESSLECRNSYRLILLDDDHSEDPHFLSKEILKHLQQEEREFCLDPPLRAPIIQQNGARPIPEKGGYTYDDGNMTNSMSEEFSSPPTLMISRPLPLRAEPVENTDYHNHSPQNYRR